MKYEEAAVPLLALSHPWRISDGTGHSLSFRLFSNLVAAKRPRTPPLHKQAPAKLPLCFLEVYLQGKPCSRSVPVCITAGASLAAGFSFLFHSSLTLVSSFSPPSPSGSGGDPDGGSGFQSGV